MICKGKVPNEGIFRNLVNLSINGNNKLCGGIPQLHLVPCKTDSVKNNRGGQLECIKLALPTTIAVLLFAIVITLIHLIYRKQRRKQKAPFQPPIVEEQYERVSYHALSNGTNGFSEANLLGKGAFGTVYKCAFQAQGTIVAVKVFDLQQSGSTKSFVAECEALRRVRHHCLMKIITCCSSINEQGQDFKALVFEFMPNGSLNRWLHIEYGILTLNNTLSFSQRLHIAVDIMDALDYLHNHCQPPIIHCDIKSSNILLAGDMSARVGDFGISRIISESESKIQNFNSTIGIRGSIGYVAPGKCYVLHFFLYPKSFYKYRMLINTTFFFCIIIEYGEGSSITTVGDVHSLGILLLEIFTGRSPTDDMFRGSMNLHKFSEDALPDKIWEIADTTLWLHTGTHDSNTRNIIEQCLVHVIALGVSCSRKQPRERTLIQDAVNEMHAIRDSYLKFARPLVVEHGAGTILQ
jgi:serine/threonine protein kinase